MPDVVLMPRCTIGSEPGVSKRCESVAERLAKGISSGSVSKALAAVEMAPIDQPIPVAPAPPLSRNAFRFYGLGHVHNRATGFLMSGGSSEPAALDGVFRGLCSAAWGRLAILSCTERYELSPTQFCKVLRAAAGWRDLDEIELKRGDRALRPLELMALKLDDVMTSWGYTNGMSRTVLEQMAAKIESADQVDIARAMVRYATARHDLLAQRYASVPSAHDINRYVESCTDEELTWIQVGGSLAVVRVFGGLAAEQR